MPEISKEPATTALRLSKVNPYDIKTPYFDNTISVTGDVVGVTTDDSLEELLEELDDHDDLSTGQQRLTVSVEERRYGKAMTIVDGFDPSAVDVASIASELKRSLATGGTATDSRIELQGDHTDRVPELLRDRGFQVDR